MLLAAAGFAAPRPASAQANATSPPPLSDPSLAGAQPGATTPPPLPDPSLAGARPDATTPPPPVAEPAPASAPRDATAPPAAAQPAPASASDAATPPAAAGPAPAAEEPDVAAAVPGGEGLAVHVVVVTAQELVVPLAGIESFAVVDPSVATVTQMPGGLRVKGILPGGTLVQVFTGAGLRVVILTVRPAPTPASSAYGDSRRFLNGQNQPRSFWGSNVYAVRALFSRTEPLLLQHLVDLRGRLAQGSYDANTMFRTGEAENDLVQARGTWTSDGHDRIYEIGDTAGMLAAPVSVGGFGLRGVRLRRTPKNAEDEVFAGTLSDGLWSHQAERPVIGATMLRKRGKDGDPIRITWGTSLVGYDHALRPGGKEASGLFASGLGRVEHASGLSLDVRAALSESAPQLDQPGHTATSVSAVAERHNMVGMQQLAYERTGRDFGMMMAGASEASTQRATTLFSRRGALLSGGAGATWTQTDDVTGSSATSWGANGNVSASIDARNAVALTGTTTITQVTKAPPGMAPAGAAPENSRQMRVAGRWNRRFDIISLATMEASFEQIHADLHRSTAVGATASGIVGQAGPWTGSVAVLASATQQATRAPTMTSVLAETQGPLTFNTGANGTIRFVQGPFESFGGFGLQAVLLPNTQLYPLANAGVKYTPTQAHQIGADVLVARQSVPGGAWSERLLVSYTYAFGNDVHARPLFAFLVNGDIEGAVCVDANIDGRCDPGEKPLADVDVHLSDGRTTRTSKSGRFHFSGVRPGPYRIDVDEPSLRKFGRLTTSSVVSGEMPEKGTEQVVFGVMTMCDIHGRVFEDMDLDGRWSAGDSYFGLGTASAVGPGGTFRIPVRSSGVFTLQVPVCGEYKVSLDAGTLPHNMAVTGAREVTVTTTIHEAPTVELGVYAIRTVSGVVFLDDNGNGRRDPGEPAIPEARVVWGEHQAPTDEDGAFIMRRMPAGAFELTVDPASLPAGLVPAAPVRMTLPNEPGAIEDLAIPVVRIAPATGPRI